jgi:hypothetical protein
MKQHNGNYAGASWSVDIVENGFVLTYTDTSTHTSKKQIFGKMEEMNNFIMRIYGMRDIGEDIAFDSI